MKQLKYISGYCHVLLWGGDWGSGKILRGLGTVQTGCSLLCCYPAARGRAERVCSLALLSIFLLFDTQF
ncbi:hypothetical protein DPQ22_00340 [Candidatus Tokpelaia sp.]|nr:hypothetical protein DPQ22_00340 [Candidatus Tokpelaia sp.]